MCLRAMQFVPSGSQLKAFAIIFLSRLFISLYVYFDNDLIQMNWKVACYFNLWRISLLIIGFISRYQLR